MANKYNLGEDTLVQGAGRFGGSFAGEGNIVPVRTTGNIKAVGNPPKMSEAEFNAAIKEAQSAGKVKSLPYQGKPVSKNNTRDAVQKTNPDTLSSGASRVTPKKDIDFTEYKKGGSVSSASKRADGIATKGKTKGRMI